jgi:choline kinase
VAHGLAAISPSIAVGDAAWAATPSIPARELPIRARLPGNLRSGLPVDQTRSGTRQTVILAAGFGSRLSAERGDLPKPLVRVAGRTLLDHALGQAVAAGVEEAIVVTGNAGELIRRHLAAVDLPIRLTVVHNPRYHEPNGVSLLCAERFVSGAFYLQMADHVFAQPVLRLLDRADAPRSDGTRLLVDFHPVNLDEDDATKVRVTDGLVTALGKEVVPYDAVDTGCFRLDPRVFAALHDVAGTEPPSVTLGMRRLIGLGQLAAIPISGVRWTDVDTPADHARAEALLDARRKAGARAGVVA